MYMMNQYGYANKCEKKILWYIGIKDTNKIDPLENSCPLWMDSYEEYSKYTSSEEGIEHIESLIEKGYQVMAGSVEIYVLEGSEFKV